MNCILCGSEDTAYQGDGNYICRRCHRSFNDLVYREPIDKSKIDENDFKINENYFKIAKKRIEQAKESLKC